MTGVNDFATQWRKMLNRTDAGYYSMTVCAGELEDIARTAWHPVSEPPTEADGDHNGDVICSVRDIANECKGDIFVQEAEVLRNWSLEDGDPGVEVLWARIRDVVLLPGDT